MSFEWLLLDQLVESFTFFTSLDVDIGTEHGVFEMKETFEIVMRS